MDNDISMLKGIGVDNDIVESRQVLEPHHQFILSTYGRN